MKHCYVLLLFTFSLFLPFQAEARQAGQLLFEKTGEPRTDWAAKSRADLKKAPVHLNESLFDLIRNKHVHQFEIENFEGDIYRVTVRRVIEQLNGDWSITGFLNGDWRNTFTLSYSDGTVLSSIQNIEGHNFYDIKYSTEEMQHYFLKVDPHERDELSCGVDHDMKVDGVSREKMQNMDIEENQGRAFIDVMIVYTPRARSWATLNAGGIQNVVNQSMAVAQNTADNANVNLQFRLVHSAEVDYAESGNSRTDLCRLTATTTFTPNSTLCSPTSILDEVHQWRNIHQADLVAMFTLADDVGGIAWLLTNPEGNSRIGFSLTRVQQAAGTTHVHEMGHNMGMAHSRLQDSNAAGAEGGVFTYSTGWRWPGQDGNSYASVMTYNEGSQGVQIFSNPNITFQGAPTGSYDQEGAPADNARSARNIMHVIASYREMVGVPEVTTTEVTNVTAGLAEGVGTINDQGESPVTGRGFCWSTSPNPNLGDKCRASVLTENPFRIVMTGLQGNTTYYARAYATNDGGTAYGENVQFTTSDISDQNSIVSLERNRVLATGEQESIIDVIVRSSSGDPVPNVDVVIEQSGGFSNVRVINDRTDIEGRAQFAISSQNEQKVNYSVFADNLKIESGLQIEFLFSNPEFKLGNNYPNPFNNQTVIPIVIPEAAPVRLDIYNSAGARVQTILDQTMDVGYFEIPFDASRLSSGVYFYRMMSGNIMRSEKMLLLK
jgi:hypothetical protein